MSFYELTIQPALESKWRLEAGKRLTALELIYAAQTTTLDSLAPIFLIAPTACWCGVATRLDVSAGTPAIYLSPMLENRSQEYVTSIVAHELAHIAAGHYLKHDDTPDDIEHDLRPREIEAGRLVHSWGFETF